ncbi:class I SAM-dependent methyltransferase [Undibacter mobilis]|uniref:Class I SAM-dependent methyltransferase n=1 Tax=Undibacter mobilis TaxID=2292256 RepID=A0A371B6D2_9BRAD|nr:class I SAM-dependent methyltransferase [Undibacter mobilis]RDV03138.1 class I SAM-dependent methyltransferase [Undibacter mobilis]
MSPNYPQMQWTPERVSRFWDWQSQYPEVYFTFQFGKNIAASLQGFLAGRRRVLDYGCGVGYLLPHLCAYAPEVYGTDPSEESVARTNERVSGIASFKGAFLTSDPVIRDMKFDAIVCIEVVEHLDDAALDAVLADVRGLLAPSGVAIFTTPNDENLSKNMILCPASGEVFHRWQHVRNWNRESLPARLRAAGFSVDKVIETNMSVAVTKSPLGLLKRLLKQFLFKPPKTPHLGCVVSLQR